jgi:tetratricopeptide (TPR) repeat protein
MRATRHVMTMLVIAALAAAGCSKRGETSPPAESIDSPSAKPVATAGEFRESKPIDGESGAAVPTRITEPMTFADGKAAYEARKYSDATAVFEGYTVRRPDNAWGHYMLGLSAWKSGDLARAESAFQNALRIDPHHVKSHVNLSRVLLDQKRYDDAVGQLTRAAAIDPSSNEVYRLLARTYHGQGKTDEALAAYREAIELNELDAWSMNNLGLLLLEQRRADEALPLFAKAVELRKAVPAFHNNLGMALEHTGRFRDAAAAYTQALAADPGYEKAKQNLARVDAVKENGDAKTTSK